MYTEFPEHQGKVNAALLLCHWVLPWWHWNKLLSKWPKVHCESRDLWLNVWGRLDLQSVQVYEYHPTLWGRVHMWDTVVWPNLKWQNLFTFLEMMKYKMWLKSNTLIKSWIFQSPLMHYYLSSILLSIMVFVLILRRKQRSQLQRCFENLNCGIKVHLWALWLI